MGGHVATVRACLALGASVHGSSSKNPAKRPRGPTPAHLAARTGQLAAITALVQAGADLTKLDAHGFDVYECADAHGHGWMFPAHARETPEAAAARLATVAAAKAERRGRRGAAGGEGEGGGGDEDGDNGSMFSGHTRSTYLGSRGSGSSLGGASSFVGDGDGGGEGGGGRAPRGAFELARVKRAANAVLFAKRLANNARNPFRSFQLILPEAWGTYQWPWEKTKALRAER